MLSDLTFLDTTKPSLPEEDPLIPLNFDDLLDIAREFEFTRTITHVWPCEDEPGTCTETRLDDILAALVPTVNLEEYPLPLTPITVNPIQVQKASSYGCVASNAFISGGLVPQSMSADQVCVETGLPITPTLNGWFPPNGSQFLDLDDSLFLPTPEQGMQSSLQLATFLSSRLSAGGANQSLATDSAVSDVQLQTPAIVLKPPPVSTSVETTDDPGKKNAPVLAQASAHAILEPVGARSAALTISNLPSQVAIASHAKVPRSRIQPSGATAANYARPPRGGIPPHIARSVTKANILRVEKERKVMQDAFSISTTKETKKPSVLRRVSKIERETNKNVNSGNGGDDLFSMTGKNEKGQRASKRAKV